MIEPAPEPGWVWFTGEPVELARYVVHHLFVGHPLLPDDMEELRRDPHALTKRLYEAVRERRIRYHGDAPFTLEPRNQPVRQPYDLLAGQRAGNCLDLSLLYAGLCSAAKLRPLLALMRTRRNSRHVLVLVSQTLPDTPADIAWGGLPIQEGRGRPTADDIARALRAAEFVAVEITAATRQRGLPFDRACEEGADVFEGATEIEVIDPVFLQKRGWKPDLGARGLFGPTPGNPAFRTAVAKEFRKRLGTTPEVWDLWHISRIPTEPGTQAHDTRLALERALLALGAFEAADGGRPGISRLQGIYYRAVGRDSEAETAEVMLVQAAAATDRKDGLTRLVRFILGVAAARRTNPTEKQDQVLQTWLSFQEVQREDVELYGESCRTVTYWALIHLGEESQDLSPTWPRTLWVSVDPPLSATVPLEVGCADEDGLEDALTTLLDRLFRALPEDSELVVDLVAPRHLLDRRIEHMELIKAGPLRQALSPQFKPRLRWSLHLLNRHGRDLQARRDKKADWDAEPQLVPPVSGQDEGLLKAWLDDHQVRVRPCLIAGRTDGPCDPLTVMLMKGQGFILWFHDGSHAANDVTIRELWKNVGGGGSFKRENMPDRLLDRLGGTIPAMIWNDLTGRGSSKLKAGRLQSPTNAPSGGDPG